jgi:hypothetical protein
MFEDIAKGESPLQSEEEVKKAPVIEKVRD